MTGAVPPRRAVLAGFGLAVAGALTGCGGQGVEVTPTALLGDANGAAVVLVDRPAGKAVTGTLRTFVRGRKPGYRTGTGAPADIAETVKTGRLVDVVVLPAGAALDRVRDELLLPPERLGRIGDTDYYLGAVTSKALAFTTWLRTPEGQARLQQQGLR